MTKKPYKGAIVLYVSGVFMSKPPSTPHPYTTGSSLAIVRSVGRWYVGSRMTDTVDLFVFDDDLEKSDGWEDRAKVVVVNDVPYAAPPFTDERGKCWHWPEEEEDDD